MSPESLEMEPWKEKLLRRSLDDSFSDNDDDDDDDASEDDILFHGDHSGPSNEDRQLLEEEDEREKLLTKKRNKVLIGSKKANKQANKHARKKSVDSRMEDGILDTPKKPGRSRKQRAWLRKAKRILVCHAVIFTLLVIGLVIVFLVRVFAKPIQRHQRTSKVTVTTNGTHSFQPTVLIISLDGFRPDYIDHGVTPNLHLLREMGVAPEYMKPSFPSLTFPNHYSLVTGLYPESHGVVANEFFDPVLKEEFNIGDPGRSLPSVWWEGTSGGLVEPIWVTAERQGVITAIHMWPGSEAVIHDMQATHVDKFNQLEPLANKVDRVLSWLDLDDSERPAFIAAYVPNTDTIGHQFGPDTPEMNQALSEVDDMIGDIMEGLNQRNLSDIVNVIIVSDHGMATTSKDRIVYLDTLMDLNTVEHIDCWPLKGLRPWNTENTTALYEHLKAQSIDQPWSVYLRDVDMPPRWHYTASYRIAPLFLVPDPGWVIVNSYAEFDPEEDDVFYPRGIHGYDNDNELMRSLFLANGPAFNYSYQIRPFANVEVYGIMTNILGIQPNPNNGTLVRGRLQRLPISANTTTTDTDTPPEDANGIPEMTEADWEEIEGDLEEAAEDDRPLTWKEYLELKAEAMKEELDAWWDWMKHGGADEVDSGDGQ